MYFVFTDIVGSSRLWHQHGDAMAEALRRHDALASEMIATHGGQTVKHTGDGVFAVFEAGDALGFALDFQRRITAEHWDAIGGLRVRVGISSGDARRWAGDFFGPAVNRAARLAEAASGGQTILTGRALAERRLPHHAAVEDLGVFTFGDLGEPEHVYQLAGPETPRETFPPLRSLLVRQHTLPIPATPFVGREDEVADLVALLREPTLRLITLTGPGGIGKTRLAIHVASIVAETYPWGAYFVPLAALSQAPHLVNAAAESLRLSFQAGRPFERQLVDFLADKRLLLVLDNLEHVAGGSFVLARLLSECPEIRVVATSRERLLLQGEHVFSVMGMPYPRRCDDPGFASYGAVKLILEACRRRGNVPTLTPEERDAILRICRVTEGLPLALELTASWLPALGLEAAARRLESTPLDMAFRCRDIPDRHRSLGAVLDCSYQLLSSAEQTALRRVSVFEGGFTPTAALQVAEAEAETLASLVEKSLLRKADADRFDLHELTRRFGNRLLTDNGDETAVVMRRFLGFYSQLLASRSPCLTGPQSRAAREEIAAEIANVRAAWAVALECGDLATISLCLQPLYLFYRAPGRDAEGSAAMSDAVETLRSMNDASPGDAAASALARARIRLGHFQALACAWIEAPASLRRGLHTARRLQLHTETALALQTLGRLWFMRGRLMRSRQVFKMSASLHRQSGDAQALVVVLSSLGHVANAQGDQASARAFYLEAVSAAPEGISPRLRAYLGGSLGAVELEMGNILEARRVLSASFRFAAEDGDPALISHVGNALGEVCMLDGDYEGAAALLEESMRSRLRLGDATLIMCTAALQARLANLRGDHETALERASFGIDQIRAQGSGESIAECMVEQAWAALRIIGPGAAAATLNQALDEARRNNDLTTMARALVVAGMLAAEVGALTRAVEILASINTAPPDLGIGRWTAQVMGTCCGLMPSEEAVSARQRGGGIDWRITARSFDPRTLAGVDTLPQDAYIP